MSTLRGGCLCGAIRYEIDGPAGPVVLCHCTMCRKVHGTAFRARLAVPVEAFRVTSGEALLSWYRSSADTQRSFCSRCGSPLINRWDGAPKDYGLALGTLDDESSAGLCPERHVFVASKAPWYEIHDELPRFAALPDPEPSR